MMKFIQLLIEIIATIAMVCGLIADWPVVMQKIKRCCPVLISIIKAIGSVIHNMIMDLANSAVFKAFVVITPWLLKFCCISIGTLLAMIGAVNGASVPLCLGCLAFMAIIGEIEAYLFRKMAS